MLIDWRTSPKKLQCQHQKKDILHPTFLLRLTGTIKWNLNWVKSAFFSEKNQQNRAAQPHSPCMLRPPHHHYFHTYSFIQQSCLLPLKKIGKHTFCIITPQNLNQNVHFHERPTLRQLKSSPLIPIEFFSSDNLFYIKQVEENSFIFFFAYRKKFVVLLRKQTSWKVYGGSRNI